MDNGMEKLLKEGESLTVVNENISLIQSKRGLTFGTDAYLLAAFIKRQSSAYALEFGGGTGIISLLCASRGKLGRVECIEIQESFADIIVRNAELNGLSDRVIARCADIRELKVSDIGREADVVLANPPYMRTDSGRRNDNEEKYIARHEVCGTVSDFCASAGRLLKHGGLFYCVWRPDRLADLICAMRDNSLEPKELCFVHANTKTAPSIVLVRAKKGASPSCTVLPPLFLNEDGDASTLTERARKIYEVCDFYE